MPAFAQWQMVLTQAAIPLYFVLAVVLFGRGLWKSYIWFWIYLLIEGLAALILLLSSQRDIVRWVHYLVQPLLWTAYVLIVIDVFHKLFSSYRGIARVARYFVAFSLAAAVVIALSTIGSDTNTGRHIPSVLLYYSVIDRAVTTALSLHLLLIAVFLAWMPVPLPANTVIHSFLFFFYFVIGSLTRFFWNRIGVENQPQINVILASLTIVFLAAWSLLLRAEGEKLPEPRKPATKASQILDRLDGLQQALARRQ
jgi:hypothetical protein